ncbi:MAG: AI-2E family transporter [Clostridiales bacterium]|nr:AI-2E family transporter [Clostridiales bacterium]
MKYRGDKKYLYWGITAFLIFAACVCFYYLVFHAQSLKEGINHLISISMPIIDGLILSYLMTPILNGIEKKMIYPICYKLNIRTDTQRSRKWIRGISIVLTLLLVWFLLYEFFSMVIPQLILSIQSIILQFPVYVTQISNWVEKLLADNPVAEEFVLDMFNKYSGELESWLNTRLLPQINSILKVVSLSLIGFIKALFNLIIGLIISIYVMGSKETFAGQGKKILYAFFETKTANIIIHDFRFTHRAFSGFISGKILDSIIIGILCFIGTTLIGTPYPVLISVIIAVTNIIPFFGPYFGAIPSALLILMIDPIQCLYFVIFILILQQFDGNILGPKILGNSTGLSSFWVIFAITIFGGLYGVFGMIIGVPAFAVLYAGIRTFINRMLKRKNLPIQTKQYMNVGLIRNKEFIAYKPISKRRRKESTRKQNIDKIASSSESDNEQTGENPDSGMQDNEDFILDDDDC